MRAIRHKFILGVSSILISLSSFGQGCSDAGFCTVSSFKPIHSDSIAKTINHIKFGINYGSADYNISVLGNYIEYNRKLNEKLSFDVKLTSLLQNGNDISAFGLSDLYINGNYRIKPKTGITIGVKIPLTDGNAMQDGLPLPMDYQSSLGTFDLLLGIAQEIKKLQIILALQQPLTQNSNTFLASAYPDTSPLSVIQSTNNFKRSGDALLRLSYPLDLSSKFSFTPSLLTIYHLSEDKFTNALDVEENITGSQGLTLNVNLYFDYIINSTNALQVNLASPLVVRDARPDGLTRSFIVNLEYKFSF